MVKSSIDLSYVLTGPDLQREVVEDGRKAAVVAEGDVAQFYLACQFGHIRQITGGGKIQPGGFITKVGHFLDALNRRMDPQYEYNAVDSLVDGKNGLIHESLRGEYHARCQLTLKNVPRT